MWRKDESEGARLTVGVTRSTGQHRGEGEGDVEVGSGGGAEVSEACSHDAFSNLSSANASRQAGGFIGAN